jgi:uncharacterized protein
VAIRCPTETIATARRLGAVFATLLLALFLAGAGAHAGDLPALTGRIVDNAGMIDMATEVALSQELAAFEKKSSDQIVVATVDSLDGEAIEPYANRLFRAWKLGQGGENNGILLLVAKSDRKMRIEVGYGLEGTLTDLHSRLIIENTMVPAFRAGDYSAGIKGAVDDIIMVLDGNAAELEARAKRNQDSGETDIDWIFVVFITLWVALFVGGMAMAILPPIFGTKIGPNRYRWLGMDITVGGSRQSSRGGWSGGGWSGGGGGWSGGGGGGWSSGGGGFSGGGGSSGGGGASGSW